MLERVLPTIAIATLCRLRIFTKVIKNTVVEANDLTFNNFPQFPTRHIACSHMK